MKLSPVQVSLLALAIVSAGPAAHAATTGAAPLLQVAQAEDAGSPQADAVRKFLSNARDVSQLSDDRLRQRLNRAQKLRSAGLPPDLDQALQQEIAQLDAEIARRSGGAQPAPQPENLQQVDQQPKIEEPPLPPAMAEQPGQDQTDQQPPQRKRHRKQVQEAQPDQQPQPDTQQSQPPAGQPVQAEQPQPDGGQGSQQVAAFLQSVRPAAELSPDELSRQMRRATELAQAPDISREQRQALRQVIREARAELRNKAGQQQEQVQQPPAVEQPPALPPVAGQPPRKPATEVQQQAQPPQPQTEQQLARPTNVDTALEQQARALLADNADVRQMNRRQLRQRLTTMRDLLATNQLSLQTREALRQKLANERLVLRREVAAQEDLPPPQPGQQQPGQPPRQQQGGTVNNNVTINNSTTVNNTNTDVRVVLNDRRPPQQLDDRELVRRIDVYRDVVASEQYDAEQRMIWRQQMEEDRRFLRRRMIEERRRREAELRAGDVAFNFNVEDRYDPRREVPDDVFAAEADDSEIADVLAAPPRREIQRRYTLDEIERSPAARDAVARIEIDTVHFGFGEGFLREEEIDKLDRIAQVLEKILAKHPDEVFLIEGHTDAVGSDQANLVLSRQRAAAVKEALVTYYVIPADNLKTVGLGERYLKIPTNQPEAENRRVSLARITPLVGQAD